MSNVPNCSSPPAEGYVSTATHRSSARFGARAQLATHAADVRSGLPGMAYVQTDPKVVSSAKLPRSNIEMTSGGGMAARLDAVSHHYGKVVALDAVKLDIRSVASQTV